MGGGGVSPELGDLSTRLEQIYTQDGCTYTHIIGDRSSRMCMHQIRRQ